MKILRRVSLLSCLTILESLAIAGSTEATNSNLRPETIKKGKNSVECRLFWKHTQYLGEHDEPSEELECEIQSVGGKQSKHGHMKKLGSAQKELIQKTAREIQSGEYVLSFEDADESGEEIKVRGPKNGRTGTDDGNVGVSLKKAEGLGRSLAGRQGRDRNLVNVPGDGYVATTGTKFVLAVRIIAPDVPTTKSASYISGSIFGSSTDTVNLKSHYAACSFNQLHFEKATHPAVTDGVIEVNVNSIATGTSSTTIREEAITAAENILGDLSQFDHVMFCIPPGTTGSWIAYAYTDHWLSVYNNNWCTYVSAQMHEVGHNLLLAHSGEGDLDYGDQSGMMGYSYSQDNSPKMCFNGAKSYQLGWFSDRTFDLNPLTEPGFSGDIVGTSEYNLATGDQVVVVKVEAGQEDFYVAFNRKNNANSGTLEGSNQIHVTTQGNGYSKSKVLAKLGAGQEYWVTIADGNGVDHDVMIRVNSITLSTPGVANVDIMQYTAPTISPAPTPAPLSCSGETRLEISLTTDKYNGETKWTLKNSDNTFAMESDPYPNSYETYTEEMCLSNGAYTFNITDVYGDGFCCSYGEGQYTLMLDGVPILDRQGDIGSYNAFPFVVGEGTTFPPSPSPTKTVTASPTVTPEFVTISTTEDAYVYQSSTRSDNNYGSQGTLFVRKTSSTDRRALIKFDLGEVPSGAAQGRLRLYVSDLGGSDRTIVVERIADTWDEGTVTWNILNPPTVEQVGTTFSVADTDLNTWIEVDVSDIVQTLTGTTLELMLRESSDGDKCVFRSKDYNGGELAPELLYSSGEEGVTDTPTVSPVSASPTSSPVTDSPTASPVAPSPGPPSSIPVQITPSADAYVYDSATNAANNFGGNNNVVVSNTNRRGLFKFVLGEAPTATAEGTLRLYVRAANGADPRTLSVKRIADNWEEGVVTYLNFSPVEEQTSASILSVAAADLNLWVEVDVSDLLQNLGGATTLVLMLEHDANSSGGTVSFRSKDFGDGTLAPQLLYSPGADPVETTLDAVEDTYIWSSATRLTNNYGDKTTMWMKKDSNDRRVLIKFDVQSLAAGPALEAKLRLFVSDIGNDPSRTIQVSRLADTPAWSESTVTWETFSSTEEEMGDTFEVLDTDLGGWVEVDVADLLNNRSGTELSLMLYVVSENVSNKVVFRSREYNLAPQLVVLQ